jgi:PAS domain S-box-containing protein
VEGLDPETQAIVLQTLLLEAIAVAEVAVVVYNDEGRYITVNDYACSILGYSREELLRHDVGDFTTGGFDRTRLLSNQRREGMRVLHRKDGTDVVVAYVVVPTRVSRLPYYLSFFWALDDNDPRAATAT